MKILHCALWLLTGCVCVLANADSYVIRDVKIHSFGEMGTMNEASILITDGEITSIGASVEAPDDATIIDGKGKTITPGVFETGSYLGLAEVGAVDRTVDNENSMGYGPAFRVVDGFNPRSVVIAANRIEGITRALIIPEPSNDGQILAGTGSVVTLGDTRDYVVRRDAAVLVVLGEAGARMSGGARAAALLRLREALNDAADYHANRGDYDRGDSRELVLGKSDLEALKGVLDGDVPLLVMAQRVSDIQATLALATEFDVKVIILGGAEAWMIAAELAEADVAVVLNPLQNLPDQFESLNSSLKNAAALNAAGVTIVFANGDSHNARNLTQLAGNAVANGLPWEAALRAITVNPALLFGIECCSLEPGSKADLVVWDGDPLEVTTFADHVFIDGRKISMKSRQTMLRDRYLDLRDSKPFAYRK